MNFVAATIHLSKINSHKNVVLAFFYTNVAVSQDTPLNLNISKNKKIEDKKNTSLSQQPKIQEIVFGEGYVHWTRSPQQKKHVKIKGK